MTIGDSPSRLHSRLFTELDAHHIIPAGLSIRSESGSVCCGGVTGRLDRRGCYSLGYKTDETERTDHSDMAAMADPPTEVPTRAHSVTII